MKKDQAKKIIENFIRKEVRKNLNEDIDSAAKQVLSKNWDGIAVICKHSLQELNNKSYDAEFHNNMISGLKAMLGILQNVKI